MSESQMPVTDSRFVIVERGWWQRRYQCGHRASRSFAIAINQEVKHFRQTANCPDCLIIKLRQAIIRCAACGDEILPGSPVVLGPSVKCPPWRPDSTFVEGFQVVLCLKMGCSFPGLPEGRWTTEGYISNQLLLDVV